MSKVKILVEMNDEEYKQYKDLLDGKYINYETTTIYEFMQLNGYHEIKTTIDKQSDSLRRYASRSYGDENGSTIVNVTAWEVEK